MLKDSCIQCLSYLWCALPSSLCSLPASGMDTAVGSSRFTLTPQLASSSFLVASPTPAPIQLCHIKLLLLTASLSFSQGQLVVRNVGVLQAVGSSQPARRDAQHRGSVGQRRRVHGCWMGQQGSVLTLLFIRHHEQISQVS